VYEQSVARSRTAANMDAREELYPWRNQFVQRLVRDQHRLTREREEMLSIVRRLRRHEQQPDLHSRKSRAFDNAVRRAFHAGLLISDIEENIQHLRDASFRDLLPTFRANRAAIAEREVA
jgi:hypothetical protein